jgi:hypothetical protein
MQHSERGSQLIQPAYDEINKEYGLSEKQED